MERKLISAIGALAIVFGAAVPAAAQEKEPYIEWRADTPPIPGALAREAAEAAFAACKKFNAVALIVGVFDDGEYLMSLVRASSNLGSYEYMRRKAFTVFGTKRPSRDYTAALPHTSPETWFTEEVFTAPPLSDKDLLGGPGALPIVDKNGELAGVISVDAGWRDDKDKKDLDICAKAGIDKIKGRIASRPPGW